MQTLDGASPDGVIAMTLDLDKFPGGWAIKDVIPPATIKGIFGKLHLVFGFELEKYSTFHKLRMRDGEAHLGRGLAKPNQYIYFPQ